MTPDRRAAEAGFTVLETLVVSIMFVVVIWGSIAAMTSYTSASATNRREITAHTRGGRALDRMQRELMNSVVPDPNDGLQVLDKDGNRIPDSTYGTPITVTGPILRVTRRGRSRLNDSRIRYETVVVEFRRDVDDLNADNRRDQLLRVETDGATTRTTVLAEEVIDVAFEKNGLSVGVRCTTRGAISGWVEVQGKKVPEYTQVVRTLRMRPRSR